jgi:hypothetical protein
MFRTLLLFVIGVAGPTLADSGDWIVESNRHAQLLLDINAHYNPEATASLGVEGHDAEIIDLGPRASERQEADLAAVELRFAALRGTAVDPRVQQDLDILVDAARDQRKSSELSRKYLLPFFDLAQAVFQGFRTLLDDRVAKDRQQAAVTRLRRYVGAEPGYVPITVLARERYEEKAADVALLGPWIVEAKQYLDNQNRYLDGIGELLTASGLDGWQTDYATLRQQFDSYSEWVRAVVLPRARKNSALPAELYANALKNYGVDVDPHALIDAALADYLQTRDEMTVIAAQVAAARGWKETDYRNVIKALKQQRIPNERLLDIYTQRLHQIEDIVRREDIVTLPQRDAAIRLASEAESAASPAPHLDPPRLIGNTGEPAQFVLPLSNPNARADAPMDDFNYDAIAWTLTAHEARPGHELQFAAMIEHGLSTARVVYAFNSANVEGWALYAEAVMKQYLPPEGQIGALQMRMMREARAFLDPMLNLGLLEPDAAQRFLQEELQLSEPMAKQEVDRYTFNAPGQATSYFYGYSRLNGLRMRTELALPGHFDARAYHDFLLGQGLLPFDLLEKAVMQQFVPAQLARVKSARNN